MAKKRKTDKVKHSRYRPMSPKYEQKPYLCSCGEKLIRVTYAEGLGGLKPRWQCPKCGVK